MQTNAQSALSQSQFSSLSPNPSCNAAVEDSSLISINTELLDVISGRRLLATCLDKADPIYMTSTEWATSFDT